MMISSPLVETGTRFPIELPIINRRPQFDVNVYKKLYHGGAAEIPFTCRGHQITPI